MPQPGEYDWLCYPLNEGEFHQYPDIDRHSPYGLLTLEMCEVANVNYATSYRTATTISTGLLSLSGFILSGLVSQTSHYLLKIPHKFSPHFINMVQLVTF